MEWASVLLFAVALSLDGFGVGVSYGMRGIRIPVLSLLVISLTSAGAISISMLGGHMVSTFVSAGVAEIIGALILIVVGVWIMFQASHGGVKGNEEEGGQDERASELLKIKVKPLGLVIQIIKEPSKADIDRSGNITGKEGFFLGLALAMDALGAGFGAAMAGFKPLLTPLFVGFAKFTLVGLGDLLGRRYAARWIGDKAASIIPGLVLIILGLFRFTKL